MKTKIDKPQDLFEIIREEKRKYLKEFHGGIVPSRVNTETAEQAMNELVNFIQDLYSGDFYVALIAASVLDENQKSTNDELGIEAELLEVLHRSGDITYRYLAKRLKSDDFFVNQRDAIWLLTMLSPQNDEVIEVITELLKSNEGPFRVAIVQVLERVRENTAQHEKACQLLCDLAQNDPDENVRYNALNALVIRPVKAKPEIVVPILIEKLRDGSAWVRNAAARGLNCKYLWPHSKKAIPALLDAVNDEDEKVKMYILGTLKDFATREN